MDTLEARTRTAVTTVLDGEMRLIEDAVRLVASGNAPRVTLAGLRFGEALMHRATFIASEHGVRIVPEWFDDEAGADIVVEAMPGPDER